jgi:succinate dehydrogenase/fumarate reductase flavoprotein subunit
MMWRNVGIVRSVPGMKRTIKKLNDMHERVHSLLEEGVNVPLLELRNMLEAARLITTAAIMRKESRGVHYVKELPERNDERWLCHILLRRNYDPICQPIE